MTGPRHAGFTLIEMLVTLMLLSLVMLGLSSALHSFAQTESRIDRRVVQSEARRVLYGFLREILASNARTPLASGEGEKPRMPFVGQPHELNWIGLMPARHGVGGMHYLHLAIEPRDGRPNLVLRYVPLTEKPVWPDWSAAPAIELSADVREVDFQYSAEDKDGWRGNWPAGEKLPKLVRANFVVEDGNTYPDLVVRVLGDGGDDAAAGAIVIGGAQ